MKQMRRIHQDSFHCRLPFTWAKLPDPGYDSAFECIDAFVRDDVSTTDTLWFDSRTFQ